MVKKGFKILIIVLMAISTLFVTVFADAPGHEQVLQFSYAEHSAVHYYMANEEGKNFYVYCFNSGLEWPDRPGGASSGSTVQTYVPDNFNHLSDEVKDKIHRVFYAGYPHNNAGLYYLKEEVTPTISELNNSLVTDAYLKSIFPELDGITLTFEGVGVGPLYDFSSPESIALMSVGEKIMSWYYYPQTPEEVENINKIATKYLRFLAMAVAYHETVENDYLEELVDYYLSLLIPSGVSVTEEEAHTATQYAIWIILKQSGVPYNNKDIENFMEEGSLTEALVDFANSTTPQIPRRDYDQVYLEAYQTAFNDQQYLLNSKGETIKNAGGINFTYNPEDGKYYSEKLKFKESDVFTAPFKIQVLKNNSEVLYETIEYGLNEFVLVTNELPDGTKIDLVSDNYWPSPIYQYRAKSDVENGTHVYQEMSGVMYRKVELGFETQAINHDADLTIKKVVNNLEAAKDATFWFDANIKILDAYGNQVGGDLQYTRYKLTSTGERDTTIAGTTGTIHNFGKTDETYNTKFYLHANEEIVIHNLPVGTTYTINEYGLSETGTSLGNWQAPTYTGNNGTLVKEGNVVRVDNTYKFTPISLSLEGTKTLKKRSDSTDVLFDVNDFSFILWPDVHGYPMPENSEPNSETGRLQKIVTNSAPTAGIALFDFGTIEFSAPGTYTYTIEEQQVIKENITKDLTHYNVEVVVTQSGDSLTKSVIVERHNSDHSNADSTPVSYLSGDVVSMPFNNIYDESRVDKEIRIKKAIENNASTNNVSRKDYQFTIKPAENADLSKYPEFEGLTSKECTVVTGTSGEAVSPLLSFTKTWFEAASDGSDTVELLYDLKEVVPADADKVAGITYSNETAKAKVIITKVEENKYIAEIQYQYGLHTDWVDTPAIFTNTYSASGYVDIDVEKKIESLITYTPSDGETYYVAINDDFERNKVDGVKTGYTLPTGNIEMKYDSSTTPGKFVTSNNRINFTRAGDYRFELSEVAGNASGISYDATKWILDVNVVDKGDGTFEIKEKYYNESESLVAKDKAVFTNKYSAELSLDLKITKELLGRELTSNDSFNFLISHSEGIVTNPCDPANTSHNHTNITHPFIATLNSDNSFKTTLNNVIKIHNAGTYYIRVVEQVPTNATMEYDPSIYVMEVKVKQDGNGLALLEDPKYYKADDINDWDSAIEVTSNFKFVNKTTSLQIEKKAQYLHYGDEYKFEITLLNSDDTPIANKMMAVKINNINTTFTTNSIGKAMFTLKANDVLQINDLPSGTKYRLVEDPTLTCETNIVVSEDGVLKPKVDGKIIEDELISGVVEKVIVQNIGKAPVNPPSYNPPVTGIH